MTTDATAALQAKYGVLLVDLHALHVQATELRQRFHDLGNEGTRIFDAVAADVSSPDPDTLLNWFLEALQDEPTLATATIPVERIRGAVLLVSGSDDRMWPSRWLADRAMQRLAALTVS